jgi:hypothetical protein
MGVLGPDCWPGALFSGAAAILGEPSLWLAHFVIAAEAVGPAYTGCWFPWHFRVKVAGHVVGRSMELQVLVCASKQDSKREETSVAGDQ